MAQRIYAMKKFDIPKFYRSPIIGRIKEVRQKQDPRKKDFSPTILDFGSLRVHIARHFGFCFGVENAIEISYKAIAENPEKRIFLLSQMIHNQDVNNDLEGHGIRFIMDTEGNQLINWDEITSDDVIIIPAFGTTLEVLEMLKNKGVETKKYDTTCPFVTRVWKRANQLGKQNHTIIIHGKHNHEETRATYSYSKQNAASLIIKNIDEAEVLADFILSKRALSEFKEVFKGKFSEGFDPQIDLERIGVINQTTMLATETQAIANFLKETMQEKYGKENSKEHMADTRDTLCYATNENQDSTYGLLQEKADLAIVVGGYNSSNTSHLVELCEEELPTFFICNSSEILSKDEIQHFDFHNKNLLKTHNYLPNKEVVDILLTSGASCPDAIVDNVLQKLMGFFTKRKSLEEAIQGIR